MAAISIKQYNALVRRLTSEGYTPRTQGAVLSTIYARVVIPPELNRGGELMTYKEAVDFLFRRFPEYKGKYTYEQYKADLKGLYSELRGQRTYKAFINTKRRQYQREIDGVFGKGYFDIDEYSTEYIRDILNEAWRLAKHDPDGSASFAEHLQQILLGE